MTIGWPGGTARKPNPKLRSDVQDFQRILWKQRQLRLWEKISEKRRPHQNPRDHLAHHLRLAKPGRDRPDAVADRQDDKHLQEKSD